MDKSITAYHWIAQRFILDVWIGSECAAVSSSLSPLLLPHSPKIILYLTEKTLNEHLNIFLLHVLVNYAQDLTQINKCAQVFNFVSIQQEIPNLLSPNPVKWSSTPKQFVGNSPRIVWVCWTIFWEWGLKD